MAFSKRKHLGKAALLNNNASVALKESFRDLKAKLSLFLPSEGAKTLAITSTSKKDGREAVVANLALSFASPDVRVAVIDADFTFDALSCLFSNENAESKKLTLSRKDGLKTYVVSIYQDLDNNIDFIPFNKIEHDDEYIDDPAIASLIQVLKETYDFVIVNAPSALSVAGMNSFASVCDGFALVCKKHSSRIQNVRTALDILRVVGANVLGVIVNDNK